MSFDWKAEILAPAAAPFVLVQPTLVATSTSVPKAISFARALKSSLNPPHTVSTNDDLPQPSIRGETVSIRISQSIEQGIDVCKRNLRGRLVLNKGDKPYTAKEIEAKLQKHWKTAAPWTLMSLVRGFYEFFFTSESDLQVVWAMGTLNLKSGLLRLFEWAKDFNIHNHRNTHAQVWIRLMALPQEYWMERTL